MKLEKIQKRYGDTLALSVDELELEEGKITAILGGSGAGKTTLLNVLAGLIPFEGRVDGATGEQKKRRENAAYLFQEAKLLRHLTVAGNLKLVLEKSQYHKIPAALARVGLARREKSYPNELSGGEKQRVALARALLVPHGLLLLDEPFSSLDMPLKKEMIALVEGIWREEGNTVVFVTHDVKEAAVFASRALVLKHGRICADLLLDDPYPRDFFQSSSAEEKLLAALFEKE